MQGEYAGTFKNEDGEKKFGVQIKALGGGKFEVYGYMGGLPGDGWDGSDRWTGTAKRGDDGVTHIVGNEEHGGKARHKGGKIEVLDEEGNVVGQAKKVQRKSPTLGKKPPEGAVVWFDGKTNQFVRNGFDGADKKDVPAKVTKDGFLTIQADGLTPHGSGTLHLSSSERPFSRTRAARGAGTAGSTSRVATRYRFSTRSARRRRRKRGIAGASTRFVPPSSKCATHHSVGRRTTSSSPKPSSTPTASSLKHARATVRHNGVVIHENQELHRTTTACKVKEHGPPMPLHLQNHGNPVVFRNIWFLPKKKK